MSAENAVPATKRAVTMEKLVNLCKRRGIVFPTSDIYGGLGSTFDYGPLGVELKRNVKEAWWREMVQYRSDVLGLDSAIFQHPRTWEASGHLQNFTDPLVDCKACKNRFRADHIQGDKCPECGGELTRGAQFQPDVQDLHGAGRRDRVGGLSAAGNGAGNFLELRERGRYAAGQAAVRRRAAGQIVPQRNHHREFYFPHARVRADGDGVSSSGPIPRKKRSGIATGSIFDSTGT